MDSEETETMINVPDEVLVENNIDEMDTTMNVIESDSNIQTDNMTMDVEDVVSVSSSQTYLVDNIEADETSTTATSSEVQEHTVCSDDLPSSLLTIALNDTVDTLIASQDQQVCSEDISCAPSIERDSAAMDVEDVLSIGSIQTDPVDNIDASTTATSSEVQAQLVCSEAMPSALLTTAQNDTPDTLISSQDKLLSSEDIPCASSIEGDATDSTAMDVEDVVPMSSSQANLVDNVDADKTPTTQTPSEVQEQNMPNALLTMVQNDTSDTFISSQDQRLCSEDTPCATSIESNAAEELAEKEHEAGTCKEKEQEAEPSEEKEQEAGPYEEKEQEVRPCEEKKHEAGPSEETEQESGSCDELEAGACEELCIIPDSNREITQAEKEAAALVTPVRDATESVEVAACENVSQQTKDQATEIYILSHCNEETEKLCEQCHLSKKSKFKVTHSAKTLFLCDDTCLAGYKALMGDQITILDVSLQVERLAMSDLRIQPDTQFSRKCIECSTKINPEDLLILAWETLEFCNDFCLGKYQKQIGANCSKCQTEVQDNCMGKYCVRFGYNIRQFCSSICLEQYKKGLKVCSYCQKEMTEEGFLAPVTDKVVYKDFCSQVCLDKYKSLSTTTQEIEGECSVCLTGKPTIEFEYNNKHNLFCGEPCFVAFKFVNNVSPVKCDMCHKLFDNCAVMEFTIYYDDALRSFCSKGCQNVYIIANRKIMPCSWCKVKKYNFDMIKRRDNCRSTFLICSLNCLNHQMASVNADSSVWIYCDQCQKMKQPLYNLTMSDSTTRSFCSYSCVLGFQNKYPKTPVLLHNQDGHSSPIPTSGPKRYVSNASNAKVPIIPIITNVESLANLNGPSSPYSRKLAKQNGVVSHHANSTPTTIVKTQIRQQIIIKRPFPVSQRNMATMCKVTMITKGTSCKTITTANKAVQTDVVREKLFVIPIPVPVYVPLPMTMYSQPFPMPFPFPLPIPVPIFIPTTRNSAKGIMKEIKKIQAKMPSDPLEAEILMMAELVAGDKKHDPTDSESEGDEHTDTVDEPALSPEPPEPNNTSFGEEMLEIAIKMAAELDEPAVDLEGALTVNTVTAVIKTEDLSIASPLGITSEPPVFERRPRGRGGRGSRGSRRQSRRTISQPEVPLLNEDQLENPSEPMEKPDANLCLKYTFGVNAWKQWVTTKNTELEQSSSRAKLFKPEILQLTSDELNYSLCLFVKEVRKPNGQEYAPDTIYYLCLGIQQYLFENNRIDNIFCDPYYEKFTGCLDEVAKKFSVLYNDSHYIITRVEEEHLWESKQLGAHSPHVLLSTLMFFNTKHFNLTSVEDHMQLSFSHIMKHWKRNSGSAGSLKTAGSRNVLLRFYPPQTPTDGTTTRKKKVYEQQENEENPLRCPVKLYEFYLSKCPESVKTRNDVFYLLPERSCVPDSPVWYSTMALPRDALEKMLHRVKMVKEINVALLTS